MKPRLIKKDAIKPEPKPEPKSEPEPPKKASKPGGPVVDPRAAFEALFRKDGDK
jgi:hypothetical protein